MAKKGYTSISLGNELERVDKHGLEMGLNRSATIRMVLKRYYDLKDRNIDILKIDDCVLGVVDDDNS